MRKYLKHPEAAIRKPRPPRPSKLDPFKEQITRWVTQDHCTNCEVIYTRLKQMGYTGGFSILKEFVHPLRPAVAGHAPVQRYETKPGEQLQFDWGSIVYEDAGVQRKFYGFTAVLGYSRMRFVTFVKRCFTLRCLRSSFLFTSDSPSKQSRAAKFLFINVFRQDDTSILIWEKYVSKKQTNECAHQAPLVIVQLSIRSLVTSDANFRWYQRFPV